MPKLRNLAVFGLLSIGACATPPDTSRLITEDKTVHQARKVMLGMSEADVRMCAGFPTMGVAISKEEKIWTYQRSFSRGSLNVGMTTLGVGPVPGVTGATGTGAEGFCNTQVRFVGGKVVQIDFAGDNNTATHINGLCVSTIDACVADALHSRTPVRPKP
jgi:hypothetical protein